MGVSIGVTYNFPEYNVNVYSDDGYLIIDGDVVNLALALYENAIEYCRKYEEKPYPKDLFYFDNLLCLNLKYQSIVWCGGGFAPCGFGDLSKAFSRICKMKVFL